MAGPGALLPREHGAYAELGFPLATGLGLAVPRLGTLALALAATSFFLAHEPLAILLGARGKRLESQLGGKARTWGTFLVCTGLVLGGSGLLLNTDRLWPELLVPAVPALLLLPVASSGHQKTLPGELLVVTVFAALVIPLAAASDVPPNQAGAVALVWWTSFSLGTLEVHAIKARYKNTGSDRWTRWASPAVSGLVLALALWGAASGPAWLRAQALALVPPSTAVSILGLSRVHPRYLKRVGWTLVGANTLTLSILLIARWL